MNINNALKRLMLRIRKNFRNSLKLLDYHVGERRSYYRGKDSVNEDMFNLIYRIRTAINLEINVLVILS